MMNSLIILTYIDKGAALMQGHFKLLHKVEAVDMGAWPDSV